jgi:hypothetical protein
MIGQSDVNKTNYGMMMIYDNTTQSDVTYLEYVPKNKYCNNPISAPTTQQQDDPYYYVYNIQDVVDMFNVASVACLADLVDKNGSAGGNAPFMIYNNNNTFSIYYDDSTFGAGTIKMYVNDDLFNLFRNFNTQFVSNGGCNYQWLVSNNLINSVSLSSGDYYIETQSFPSFQNGWSPVSSITFLTTMGIQTEYIDSPVILSSQNIGNISSNNVENCATDITLPIDNPCEYNSCIIYIANVYREASIRVNEIRDINLKVFWKNKAGKIYPVMLSDNESISCKIMFKRVK